MKKIYLLLLISLMAYEMKGQPFDCSNIEPPFNECYAPWRTLVLTVPYSCNGVNYEARVTFCAYCDVTNPRVCIKIQRIENIPANCQFDIYDAQFMEWLSQHIRKFCGNYPCGDIQPMTYHIKFPVCIDFIFEGTPYRYTIQASRDCNSFCYWELEACWCNCTPDCDPNPNCTPHVKWEVKQHYLIGLGTCNPVEIYFDQIDENDPMPFLLNCIKASTYCDPEGYRFVQRP